MENKDICIECNKGRIINKTKKLCSHCNYKRLHNGKSMFEVQLEKQKNKVQTIKKSVKKITTKKKDENVLYFQTCEKIDNSRELICSGCESYQGGMIKLSHSHIISREDCKRINRVDLIADENNITYHCLDFGEHVGCHRKWESKKVDTMQKLLDFNKNMEYIKSINIDLFNKIINR